MIPILSKIELFGGPTVTAVGTPHIPVAQNRHHAESLETLFYFQPTVSADGDLLATYPILATASQGGKFSASGVGGENDEWVLKNGTDYLLRLTNNDTNSQQIYTNCLIYEQRLAL